MEDCPGYCQERIEKKLDTVLTNIGSINVTIGKQQVTLDEHIRRTEILEAQIEPLREGMSRVNGILKLIGLCSTIALIVEAVVSVMRLNNH